MHRIHNLSDTDGSRVRPLAVDVEEGAQQLGRGLVGQNLANVRRQNVEVHTAKKPHLVSVQTLLLGPCSGKKRRERKR